jgi:D-alanyl-lipoteichoic acid acyltransferase DltB (MBOAT superfamily)
VWAAALAFAGSRLSQSSQEEWAGAASLYWLFAFLWTYASIEALTAFAIAAFEVAGFRLPPLHRDPILARTLAEFWARRWNLTVHRMLRCHFYRPVVARFGPNHGVLVAFAASSLLHFWLFLPVLGVAYAMSAAAFFLLHGALVLAERKLAVHRWRRSAQHLWTATHLVLTGPLIVGPLVRVVFAA